MKKQNKLNKKTQKLSYFIKHKNHFFKIINTIIYISHKKKTCFFIKYKKKLKNHHKKIIKKNQKKSLKKNIVFHKTQKTF